MEKYYLIKKEYALRAGLDESVREETGGGLILSERDLRMVSLTTEEKLAAIGGMEYTATEAGEDVELENEEENGKS